MPYHPFTLVLCICVLVITPPGVASADRAGGRSGGPPPPPPPPSPTSVIPAPQTSTLVMTGATSPPSRGTRPSTDNQARQLAATGEALYARGDYEGAIAAFTKAQELAPNRVLVFNLAQAHRRASLDPSKPDAATYHQRLASARYQEFLHDAPSTSAERTARDWLAQLDRQPTDAPSADVRDEPRDPEQDRTAAEVRRVEMQQDRARFLKQAGLVGLGVGLATVGVARLFYVDPSVETVPGHDRKLTITLTTGAVITLGSIVTYALGVRMEQRAMARLLLHVKTTTGGAVVGFGGDF